MAVSAMESAIADGTALTRGERAARGKAARAVVPRSSHARFERGSGQPAPLDLPAHQDSTRVPELLPIRYGRMAVSPFTYLRGAALPTAADLAGTPRAGFTVQACGDAHLLNFGLFASPARRPRETVRSLRGHELSAARRQTVSDVFLGWVRVQGFDGRARDFSLRQLRDGKGSAAVGTFDAEGMLAYARLCGWTLARAHARTGDPITLGAYLGAGTVFDDAIADFTVAYADQNERDHAELRKAVAAGRVAAEPER